MRFHLTIHGISVFARVFLTRTTESLEILSARFRSNGTWKEPNYYDSIPSSDYSPFPRLLLSNLSSTVVPQQLPKYSFSDSDLNCLQSSFSFLWEVDFLLTIQEFTKKKNIDIRLIKFHIHFHFFPLSGLTFVGLPCIEAEVDPSLQCPLQHGGIQFRESLVENWLYLC